MMRLAIAVAAALAGTLTFAAPGPAATPLRVVSLLAPAGVSPGVTFEATDRVARRGSARGTVRFLLSEDGRRDRRDVLLRRARQVKGSTGTTRLTLPTSTKPGRYVLLACIGRTRGCKGARVGVVRAFRPRPLDLVPTLDRGRAVATTATPEGTTVEATAADGTRFRLIVPARAVQTPTPITMTPVTAVPGLPLKRLGGLVELAPHGLRLDVPAELEVRPAKPVDPRQAWPLAAAAGGKGFHLDLGAVTRDAVRIPLQGFSVHGFALGPTDQAYKLVDRPPSSRGDWARQNLAKAVRDPAASREQRRAAAAAAHWVWAQEVIRPLLQTGQTNDDALYTGLAEYHAWQKSRALNKDGDTRLDKFDAEFRKLALSGTEAAAARAVRRCRENADPHQIRTILSLQRQLDFLGKEATATIEVLLDQIQRCANFEVEFTSSLGSASADVITVRSVVPVPYQAVQNGVGDRRSPYGGAPLTYPLFPTTRVTESCGEYEEGEKGSWGVQAPLAKPVFNILSLDIPLTPVSNADPGIRVRFDTGKPTERYRNLECDGDEFEYDTCGWWFRFDQAHAGDRSPGAAGEPVVFGNDPRTTYEIAQFQRGAGFLYARFTSERLARTNADDEGNIVRTTIDVRHRPIDEKAPLPPLPAGAAVGEQAPTTLCV